MKTDVPPCDVETSFYVNQAQHEDADNDTPNAL